MPTGPVYQMSFDHSRLPRDYPRQFLPPNVDFIDQARLNEWFDKLEKRPLQSREDMERWLKDESELVSAILEEQTLRYVRMTCQTDDPEREKAYLFFVENVEPLAKLRAAGLDRKYVDAPARKRLPDWYSVLDRKRENNVALFRKENVELEKKESLLSQKYQKLTGAMTAIYDGQERTMQQLAKYLEEPKREVRQETWLIGETQRHKDKEALDQLYDEMLTIRQQIAKNAGFENYRDYIFRKKERFDYTPEDCFRYHEAVEKYIVPLLRELDKDREQKLSVDSLRPWDLAVDPKNRPPLRPFKTPTELVQGCVRIFDQVNPTFGRNLRRMAELGLLDLESRKGKAPGGYQSELMELRLPFIFMNAVGRDLDTRTLLHESGHAFHTFAIRDKNLPIDYRGEYLPLEIAEVASQSMEIIGGEHLEGTFYNKQDAMRSRREHLTTLVRLLAWIATIDAFQHWVYTHPGHTQEERERYWVKLRERFGSIESWEGYEHFRRSFWQRQLHLYEYPFYYIEYAIAWTGALGIWTRYREDPKGAVEAYERALSLGGSKPLPELFDAADLPFDFGPKAIEPYAHELRHALRGE